MNAALKKDFFISYNRHDRAWAEWIAATLEKAGYSTIIQAWDFRPGGNFVLDMHDAIDQTKRTIAVLSPNYLQSEFTQPEWAAAFVQDPRGKNRTLIPVRVEACELTGLLRAIVYVDLVGIPESEAEKLLLQAVSDARTKPLQPSEFPQLGTPANLPIENKLFVGREQALEELHEKVRSGELTAISSIKGMGGIGKTELALQYALKHLKSQDYPGGVCWLRAREDIGLQIVQFAREKLGVMPPDDRELMAQVEWCWTNWQKAATLLVFDDVQAYDDIKPFLPKHRDQFRVLLTTRKYLDGSVRNYEIQVLSEAASLELLRRSVTDGRIDQELETAKQVCEWLGYLPLGLELVGRYLARKKGCSVAKLWERLQEQRLAAKALLETEPGMTATLNVTAAFELSWQELNEDAQRLAAFLSLFALADIPWRLVQECFPETDEEDLEDLRDAQLVNLSLLSFEGGENYQLHQLLREFFGVKRSQMPEDEEMKRSFCRVVVRRSRDIFDLPNHKQIEQIAPSIPHIIEVAKNLETFLDNENALTPFARLAWFYEAKTAYIDAAFWHNRGLEVVKRRHIESHIDIATASHNLARIHHVQAKFDVVEDLLIDAVKIYKQCLGIAHPGVAPSLVELAELYHDQGRYLKAELCLSEAKEIYQTQIGDDCAEMASILNNLACLFKSLGRYQEAKEALLKALTISERYWGENHPYVARSLNNLAGIYELRGCYSEAESCYSRSLKIDQSYHGMEHPSIATSLNNLAGLRLLQEQYKEAKQLYLEALRLSCKLLGESHPKTLKVWQNIQALISTVIRKDRINELF
ncbi:kinesin light chain [Leptolyngbya sp. NIES-3755]|nr:kinesin light chain [Leptolyngbya sp. NIES-3755]